MFKVFSDIKFLFTAPLILGMLFVINLVTSPGDWWVQWAALGMGIAWVVWPAAGDPRGHRRRRAGGAGNLAVEAGVGGTQRRHDASPGNGFRRAGMRIPGSF